MVELQGKVLVARLNRPEARNALTASLISAIGAAMVDAESDARIRAAVLTGTGDRAFCTSEDLRAFAKGASMALPDNDQTRGFYRSLNGEVGVPVIGAANATAVAGGFELLLGCDIIVASSDARFGLPEVQRALFPGGNGTLLGRRIPLGIALEMTLTGDSITATRAHELGLVNAVVSPDEVLGVALDYANRIAANGPLRSRRSGSWCGSVSLTLRARRPGLSEWQRVVFSSDDAKEGARAFVEKRAPAWQGR